MGRQVASTEDRQQPPVPQDRDGSQPRWCLGTLQEVQGDGFQLRISTRSCRDGRVASRSMSSQSAPAPNLNITDSHVELFNYFFAVARRLDSTYSLCVGAISTISAPPDNRARFLGALSDAELMCIVINRVAGMIKAIAITFSVATTVPHENNALSPPVKAIEALSKSKQLELSTSGILRYGNHSLDLRAQVIPSLVAARKGVVAEI